MNHISIFVTVGTNHYKFDRMLGLVDECLKLLDYTYSLNVQYGHCSPYVLAKNIEGSSESIFPRDTTEQLYRDSDLVFSHCGIGSIYNSLHFNRPTVIIPRLEQYKEFSDDHQLQISREICVNPMVLMLNEQIEPLEFKKFIDKTLFKERKLVDLTNYQLAEFIRSKLLDSF